MVIYFIIQLKSEQNREGIIPLDHRAAQWRTTRHNTVLTTADRPTKWCSDPQPWDDNNVAIVFSLTRPIIGSPLNAGLNKKRGTVNQSLLPHGGVEKRAGDITNFCKDQTKPLNMYLGENFNVSFHENFNFWKFLNDNSTGGLIQSEFMPNKNFANMTISKSAQRIRDVPNAGGNSVISEVLSFEFLNKAFQAELVKVRH